MSLATGYYWEKGSVSATDFKVQALFFSDSPVLWIRLDPDMQLIRSLDIQQPDFQWQYQLRHERDITAQFEAVWALERFASPGSKKALVDIIEEEKCFYKVRGAACHSLTKVCNAMATTSEGPPALLVIFKKMYGSFANSSICKQNDFSNLQSYFLQKEIPVAMAGKATLNCVTVAHADLNGFAKVAHSLSACDF